MRMENGEGRRERVQKMTAPWCFCIIQPHRHVVYILYTKLIMRLLLVWGWEDYIVAQRIGESASAIRDTSAQSVFREVSIHTYKEKLKQAAKKKKKKKKKMIERLRHTAKNTQRPLCHKGPQEKHWHKNTLRMSLTNGRETAGSTASSATEPKS